LSKVDAAVRFVSYEPALGPVDFMYPKTIWPKGPPMCCSGIDCGCMGKPTEPPLIDGINWIIVGGESGPGCRPFNIQWARNTIMQCKAAGVACFVKQLGGNARMEAIKGFGDAMEPIRLKDRKGGDWDEWPGDLRVRQFPKNRIGWVDE
jgi:protein gp37